MWYPSIVHVVKPMWGSILVTSTHSLGERHLTRRVFSEALVSTSPPPGESFALCR